jgi:hypothetical protein
MRKKIEPSRGIRNKDRSEFPTPVRSGRQRLPICEAAISTAGAFVPQAKYQMQNIKMKEARAFAKASP